MLGLNTFYQANDKYPVFITANDFSHNNSYIPVISLFLPDKDGKPKEFPAEGRDDIIERIPALRKRFNNYKPFALATMDDIFPGSLRQGGQRLKATMLQSCYLRNEGNGKFTLIPLPKEAQVSVINGMVVDDFDGDGNLDVAINGNDYGTEVSTGRYDALNGLVLKGDGKGGFTPLNIMQSGLYIPGNGKALIKLEDANHQCLVVASQNKGPLKVYRLKNARTQIPFLADDTYAIINRKNGSQQKVENYFGSSFLSQSAHFFSIGKDATSVVIVNSKKQRRNVLGK